MKKFTLSLDQKKVLYEHLREKSKTNSHGTGRDNFILVWSLENIKMSIKQIFNAKVDKNKFVYSDGLVEILDEEIFNLWLLGNREKLLPWEYDTRQIEKKLMRIGKRIGFDFRMTAFNIKKSKQGIIKHRKDMIEYHEKQIHLLKS